MMDDDLRSVKLAEREFERMLEGATEEHAEMSVAWDRDVGGADIGERRPRLYTAHVYWNCPAVYVGPYDSRGPGTCYVFKPIVDDDGMTRARRWLKDGYG